MSSVKMNAKWIWKKDLPPADYNRSVVGCKKFTLKAVKSAKIMVTADTKYRLYINGKWVNDGPARGWANHFQTDVIQANRFLKKGENEVRIFAFFDGSGTFHKDPQRAGFIFQLDVKQLDGKNVAVVSDSSWDVAEFENRIVNTPKISVQREPFELFDARIEKLRFTKAAELYDVKAAPYKNLTPRCVALMTKKPFSLKSFKGANIVKRSSDMNFCVYMPRLVTPGVFNSNRHVHYPFGMASVLKVKQNSKIKIESFSWRDDRFLITVDGKSNKNGVYKLAPGSHLILAFSRCAMSHDRELSLRLKNPPKIKLENPLDAAFENPWCYLSFEEFAFSGDDIVWENWLSKNPRQKKKYDDYIKITKEFAEKVKDTKSFKKLLADRSRLLKKSVMFVEDDYWRFREREVIDSAEGNVTNQADLMYDNCRICQIKPDKRGDLEIIYDLGQQNCGYWSFELWADEGVVLDIYGVEYINDQGRIQHTSENRNGLRYITRDGFNSFTSFHRRSCRYILITLRNQKKSIAFNKFQLIESTYPVNYIGSFQCDDERLNRIWDISARALKLCMEDVYVDCPLYEQTLWIGDARNEGLFGYYLFDAVDIARNSLRLGAQSLEYMPLVGCQVPTCWHSVIPVWSFLWGIAVWENYWYSGDLKFLKEMWKYVLKNIKNAQGYIDRNGLFTADMWNLFDWADIDQGRDTVLHNSMFMAGAVDAACKCALVLGDDDNLRWLRKLSDQIKNAVNKTWNRSRNAYPDSYLADGSPSQSICQHTNFLAVLYDIVSSDNYGKAVDNMLNTRDDMVMVGSPFAILYLYEAMEKAGQSHKIIESIYENYIPMLEDGATTTWEVFQCSPVGSEDGKFPTRSHCHGWSAAPVYFLNRIILGLKQTSAGCESFELSPMLNGLKKAKGSIATSKGPITVSWERKKNNLSVRYKAPKQVKVQFKPNDSHKGLKVSVSQSDVMA